MKHVIIGTAGHVDHGKTSLIRALTGTNTDRLKEEQERGMTIDIGFAALKLPDGTVAGIVDVPGHERFLKNMLAGASGVDVVLLVVAADESVMPQTEEHLEILRLLDVRNGVVALTKIDLVEPEWAETVEEDIRAHLKETFLAAAPIVRVSPATGKGIEALKKILMSAVSRAEERNSAVPFRLPIDRIFTRPGFGTVVTGTLTSGTLRVGDSVDLQPQGLTSRVRGLQIHNHKVTEAAAGSRVAVNLAGMEPEQIERGSVLSAPTSVTASETFDAVLRLLPNAPRALKDRARVRVYTGTTEAIGRVRLLDERQELPVGERAFVQFRSERPLACVRGDRFVVRSYSPLRTIGGGVVLDVSPRRHRKADAAVLGALEARERGTPEDLLETLVQSHPFGIPRRDAAAASRLTPAEAMIAVDVLLNKGALATIGQDRVISAAALRAVTERAINALSAYHERYPLRPGMPKEEFRTALGQTADARSLNSLTDYWTRANEVAVEGATVRLHNFQVALTDRQQALLARIEEVYITAGIAMPSIEDVVRAINAPPDAVTSLLRVGVSRGRFHRLADDRYYHEETIAGLQALVTKHVQENGSITVSAFRDLTHSNRRFSMLVLEYFDQIRFTRRAGDERTLA